MARKVPSYRLHRASGQAVVTLSGKTTYLGKYGTKASRKAYDLAIAEWLARQRMPERSAKSSALPITELIAAYWRHAQAYYRRADGQPTGEVHPLKAALRMLKQSYGTLPVDEFSPLKLQAVRERMIAAGWSRSNINAQVRRIIRLFKWGVAQEIVPADVPTALREVAGLERGRTEAKESEPVRPVADDVFQATIHNVPAVVADLLRLMRRTGMRPDEACSIRPGDIDRGGDVWLYTPRQHKTERHGRARVVPLGPAAQAILAPYLLRGADDFCFSPAESETKRLAERHAARTTPAGTGNEFGQTFTAKRKRPIGERYDANSLRKAIHRGCEIAFNMPAELRRIPAKVKGPERKRLLHLGNEWRAANCWAPNRLRHSFGTEVRRTHGLEAAQVLLGHSEADVTQVYAEADQRKAVEIARVVG